MAWQDKLQRGKFRDAEFFTDSVDNAVGRRTSLHEYPLRDKPYAEDMGRQAREFTVECFVIGDDYMVARDKLRDALEKKGPGALIHPYWGSQNVQVLKARVRESSDEGRLARFIVTFTEAGENETPNEDADTASIVNEKVNSGINASIGDFANVFGVKGWPEFVATDAVSVVNSALDNIAASQSAVAAVDKIKANVNTAVNNPLVLATDITGAVAQVTDIPTLKKLHSFGSDIATIDKTTKIRAAQSDNQIAIINMVRTSSVLETARLLV